MTKLTLAISIFLLISSAAQAQYYVEPAFPNISFSNPVDMQSPRDGSNRLFVVEQEGRIRVFDNSPSAEDASIFIDLTPFVKDSGSEEGLLGMAFDPDFSTNGYFYASYTAANPSRSVIARYSLDASDESRGDSTSGLVILEQTQPRTNHNGGQIQFGPDGFLYIGLGDGGGSGDPDENGQDRKTLLGSMLRIDVSEASVASPYSIPNDNPFVGNSEDFREEIWAWGLRNPWRFSFDSATGELWAGDVGQGSLEEVDIIEKGKNYGWNTMEANLCFAPMSGCDQTGLTLPVWQYDQGGSNSITGGYVYRGSQLPELTGKYIYGDFVSSRVWVLEVSNGVAIENVELIDGAFGMASFGVDEANELYLIGYDGVIRQLNRDASSVDAPENKQANVAVYPNPFQQTAYFAISTAIAANVELTIYDVLGRAITLLHEQDRVSGEVVVSWDGLDQNGSRVPPGVYLYRLKAGNQVSTGSLVRL